MAENKTKPTTYPVETFIAEIENKRRQADAMTSLKIYKEVTGLDAVMWGPSIIGFGVHNYVYESGRKGSVPAAAFSPRKANMTFYVGNKFQGADELYAQLGEYRKSTACLYINKLEDVDITVLKEIIKGDYKHVQAKDI